MELTGIKILHESDIGRARRMTAQVAKDLGLSEDQVAQCELVATEMASNLLVHKAQQGLLWCEYNSQLGDPCLTIYSIDEGPGIPDPFVVLQDGFSTHGSLGIGMGTIRRNVDEMILFSRTPKRTDSFLRTWAPSGTLVLARKWLAPQSSPWQVFAHTESCTGESYNGDGMHLWNTETSLRLAVCDGLGHGWKAHEATQLALSICQQHPNESLLPLLERIHHNLRKTRGCALLLADLNQATQSLEFICVGNITLRIDSEHKNNFIPYRGILGSGNLPKLSVQRMPWTPQSTCYVYSDGLSGRWSFSEDKEFFDQDIGVIGPFLLRDHSREKDDTTLVILRDKRHDP